MTYQSQHNQDKFVDEYFRNKENGFFLDIGAHDGVAFSNTLFLEKERKWSGICFEPNPNLSEALKKNRDCECINSCVWEDGEVDFLVLTGYTEMLSGVIKLFSPEHTKRIQDEMRKEGENEQIVKVSSVLLPRILEERQITTVDYCSLDVEGGELDILKTIDFNKVNIQLLTVEANSRKHNKALRIFMYEKNYSVITELGCDIVFERKE